MRKKKDGEFFELLWTMFTNLPWWVGPPVIALTYLLFTTVFPALIQGFVSNAMSHVPGAAPKGLPHNGGPLVTVFAPVFTLGVTIMWLASLVHKLQGKTLLRRSVKVGEIKDLTWETFERLVCEYYRQEGFWVERRGGAKPDGGVDLEAYRDGELILVQCKHWKAWKVGVRHIRELRGVMAHEGARHGVLVCSGEFTQEAQDFARQNNVELVDGNRLSEMIRRGQEARTRNRPPEAPPAPQVPSPQPERTPACPKCGEPMVQRKASKGAYAGSNFWGCKGFPGCKGIRNM